MGKVIVSFRIMPEDMKYFESIGESLRSLNPQRLEEEPIAFGLKAWKFTKLVPDDEGGLTNLEEKLKSIDGVQSVETVEITRSL